MAVYVLFWKRARRPMRDRFVWFLCISC